MTNKAQYKLKLLLGENGSKPLANTAYVITAQGKILSKGSTSSVGETAVFEVVGLTSIQVKFSIQSIIMEKVVIFFQNYLIIKLQIF